METIVSLLVLGAIFLITYVVKSLSTSQGDGGKQVFGEGFPTIEILEPEQEPEQKVSRPSVAPRVSTIPTSHVERSPQFKKEPAQSPRVASNIQLLKNEDPAKHGYSVALNNKSDAKRAFIHSEIFNRKY